VGLETNEQLLYQAPSRRTWLCKKQARIGTSYELVRVLHDNQCSQKLVKGFGFHPRTKNIDLRHHFIQEKHISGGILVEYL